jgi:hypothetical protein
MKHISLISIMILSLIVNGQDVNTHKRDSIFLAHANAYLNKKLDSEFVMKNLKFVQFYNANIAGHAVAIYETTTTKNTEGRNTIILYFKYGTNEVDTVLSVFNKEEILKSIRGDSTCTLYIGIEKATEIAKKAVRTDKGIKYWDIDIMNVLPKQIPKWSVDASYLPRGAAYNRITEININMTDGKYETSYGFSQP